jgi:hypothetical protein
MAINLNGGLPPEILGQQQQLNRQQQMAQALMQQGMQQPQGQMVSGRYVAPSFFQNILPLAQMYVGKGMAEQADKKALDMAAALRKRYGDEIKEFRTRMQGVEGAPERTTEMAGPYGQGVGQGGTDVPMPTAFMPARAAVAPNPQGAYDFAAGASNPALQAVGLRKLTEGPEQFTLTEGAKRFITMPDGTVKEVAAGADKQSPEYKNYLIAKNDPINPFKGGFTDYQISLKKAGASNINLGQKDFDNTLKLRGDFRSEPVYKGFQEVESAFGQINKGLDAKSPAGDLASATKFMKLLDPTSVVRESELAMAMQATGALDKLYNYANLISTGQKLTPSQRNDFRSLAKDFYSTAYDQYNTKRGEYVGIAERNKLNIEDVVGKEPKAPIKMLSAQDQEALNWAKKNPTDPRAKQINQRLGQ